LESLTPRPGIREQNLPVADLRDERADVRVVGWSGLAPDGLVECAPGAGQFEVSDLTGVLGFRKMKAMARQQRSHSIEFKRQVVQEYIAGETL
jgi:hypothetical protein